MTSDPPGPPASPHQPPAGEWRPSQSDRQAAAERLRAAVDEERLDLMEYDQRLRATETAATMSELDRVLADLPLPAEPLLVQIGELAVTQRTVHTPAGPIPLRGSQWTVQDQWLTERKTPTWAIVLAIVGASLGVLLVCFTFFLSLVLVLCLLFLLAKETRFHGTVDVGVTNQGRHYVARIPVYNQQQVQHIYQQVNYVRSLAVS